MPPEVPRFLKDNLEIDDIEGTRPDKLGFTKTLPTKDLLNVRDIPGAYGRKLTYTRNLGIYE